MLNFYDTEAVKAFTLKILVENRELKDDLDFERRQSTDWFHRFKEAEKKAGDVTNAIELLDSTIAAINTSELPENPVRAKEDWALVTRCLETVVAVLKGGPTNE